jgi:GNAT superfamily N-acetyltransferase
MKTDIIVSFNPDKQNLDEIIGWMENEKNSPKESQGNWLAINSAFSENRLITASIENKTIGFFALLQNGSTATISVAEIHPEYRNKGVAKFFLNQIIDFLLKHNYYALDLMCAPASSETIWKKLGFANIPESTENKKNKNIILYRIITPILETTNKINEGETIEIWNNEPYSTVDDKPTWSWELKFREGTRILIAPIIQYVNYKWRIRWKIRDRVIKDCMLQHFDENIIDYVIIKNLSEIT